MKAMSHWYSSSILWSVIAAILALAQVILGILVFILPWISSKRIITYELRASEPLIRAPADVDPGLQVAHHGKTLINPHIIIVWLAYRGRKDLPSSAFDQGAPLVVDVGIEITALVRKDFRPGALPIPKVEINGTALEIGPSLLRKKLEMEFFVLADGPDVSLDVVAPLADIKVRPQKQEEEKRKVRSTLLSVSGWACVAFIVWWIIEDPAGAAHIVHNIGAFLAGAANGFSHFVDSL